MVLISEASVEDYIEARMKPPKPEPEPPEPYPGPAPYGEIVLAEITLPRIDSGVYFAYGAGKVKIGFSTSPRKRIRSLANTCPVPLQPIAWLSGPRIIESAIHEACEEDREHGEWFTASQVVLRIAYRIQNDPGLGLLARMGGAEKPPEEALWRMKRQLWQALSGKMVWSQGKLLPPPVPSRVVLGGR